jgi:hypothetical protein
MSKQATKQPPSPAEQIAACEADYSAFNLRSNPTPAIQRFRSRWPQSARCSGNEANAAP